MSNSRESLYRRYVELIGPGYFFYSHDLEGTVLFVTPHIEIMLGVPATELLGKKWQEVLGVTEAALRDGMEATLEAATGSTPAPLEMEFRDLEGNKVVLEIHARPFFDESGAVAGLDGIAKNVTERKTREEERERLIAELERSLEEIRTLRGIIPICSYCKNIRNEAGAWDRLETYIGEHTDARFSHGVCPTCLPTLLGGRSPDELKD